MRTFLPKLLFITITLCGFAFNAQSQETLFAASSNNYYNNIFDDASLHSFTAAGTTNAITFSTAAANNLDPTVTTSNCLQSGTVSGAGTLYNSIITPAAPGTVSLNSNNYEWSILYQTTYTAATNSNIVDLESTTPATGKAGWRYWLNSSDKVPGTSTTGLYLTQVGNKLILRSRNSQYDVQTIMTYTLPTPSVANPVYNIKIQRSYTFASTAYWYMAVNEATSISPDAYTQVAYNTSAQNNNATYYYTVLESNSKTAAAGTFKWDNIKLYTTNINVTGANGSANNVVQNPYLDAGASYPVYGIAVTSRGLFNFDQMRIKTSGGSDNMAKLFSAFKLYVSTDASYSSDDVLIGTSTDFTGKNIRFNSVNQHYYDSTVPGQTLYYFLVGTVNTAFNGTDINFTENFDITSSGKNDGDGLFLSSAGAAPYEPYMVYNTWDVSNTITYHFTYGYDWAGRGTDWATAADWNINGVKSSTVPGASDNVRIGVVAYVTNNQPTLSAAKSVANIEFGKLGSTSTTAAANVTLNLNAFKLTAGYGVTLDASSNVVMNGTGTLAISGASSMASTSSLGFTSGVATKITSANTFTMYSDATGSASILAIPAGGSVTGNISVQRYVTGGSAAYRGYRLFTSPINVNSLTALNTTVGYIGLSYLNSGTGAIETAGPGGKSGGFSETNANPLLYLYDESRISSNASFVAGKNVGITAITGSSGSPAYSVSTLSGTTAASGVQIPVGNSILLYYVGSNKSSVITSTRVPDAATSTATGYINQGSIPVVFWNTNSTAIPYHTDNGGRLPGLNQVGNPYPSTISLDQLYIDNPAISPQFWELDEPGGTYISYSAGGATSNTRASKYIVSGQGFIAQALTTGQTITFQEDQKVPYPTGFTTSSSPGALLLSMPSTPSVSRSDMPAFASMQPQTSQVLTGLHLQITKDSITNTQTGIYFSNKNSDAYNQREDAIDLDGTSPKVYLSSYSSDGARLGINQLGDYSKGKRIKLYTSATSTGLYTMSLADIANIDTATYNVYLVDKKMNDSLDMVHYRSYAFNINTADTTTYGANRFVLAVELKPLPQYLLVSFSGQKVTTGIQLYWQTLNAGNYTGFVLQKLGGDNNYNSLYTIQSNNSPVYTYIDQHPVTGNNVYRLQQTGINGNITYSAPITIAYNSTAPNGGLTIYPNPAKSVITVSLTANVAANSADIYNTSGTLIKHEAINSNTFTEDISAYKLGVYIIELKTNSGDLLGKSKFVKIN